MISCGYVGDMLRKSVKRSETAEDIKGAVNLAFELFDDLKVPIEQQWRCVGIVLDKYRKENYNEKA